MKLMNLYVGLMFLVAGLAVCLGWEPNGGQAWCNGAEITAAGCIILMLWDRDVS